MGWGCSCCPSSRPLGGTALATHPPPRHAPCSCHPGSPAWPSAGPPSPGWPRHPPAPAGTPGRGQGGWEWSGCVASPCCTAPHPTYFRDASELETLLRCQREGGVVLQEEEEVLLPAHLRRGEAWGWGRNAHPSPSASRRGPGDGWRYPRGRLRNALEPLLRGPAGLHLRLARRGQVVPQPLVEVAVQSLWKASGRPPHGPRVSSGTGQGTMPTARGPVPALRDPRRALPRGEQWGAVPPSSPELGRCPQSCYLHDGGQLHAVVVVQVGIGGHQREDVLVLHACKLPRVLGQLRGELGDGDSEGW